LRRDVGLQFVDLRALVTDDAFKARGGIARYALDYGDAFRGSTGVMEIRTGVEQYKTRAAAAKGYARWQHVDSTLPATQPGAPAKKLAAPGVGQKSFAFLFTWTAPGLNPIDKLDEQVLVGRYVLDLTVTAGSAKSAKAVAPHLLRLLNRRLQLMLAGHLSGTALTLPPAPQAEQAPGAPDLSTLILQPRDVAKKAAVALQQYVAFRPALSAYLVFMQPAGPYDQLLEQIVGWWPTATEATYVNAYVRALLAGEFGPGAPVDVSAVGDNATAFLVDGGTNPSYVVVTLSQGQAGEFVIGETTGTGQALQASDVQSLAQAAATRLDAGLGP
jgi:hypothetical protein